MERRVIQNYGSMQPEQVVKFSLIAILTIMIIAFLSSSYYTIEADEKGVVQRFGKYSRTTEPGLHFKFPMGIEKVTKLAVKKVFTEEFGFRTKQAGVVSTYKPKGQYEEESIMLCGDLNIADVEWIIQYKIDESLTGPQDFLFNIRSPQRLIRDASEAVMRKVVGDTSVDEVLTERRNQINIDVQKAMKELLSSYNAGIDIVSVKLQKVNPPDEVKAAFNDVNASQQDREKLKRQAEQEFNEVVPKAMGEAQQKIKQAEAYMVERVNKALGDANRFNRIYDEYIKSPDVTRRRLYLESLSETLPNMDLIIIDDKVKGVLPLMNLEGAKK